MKVPLLVAVLPPFPLDAGIWKHWAENQQWHRADYDCRRQPISFSLLPLTNSRCHTVEREIGQQLGFRHIWTQWQVLSSWGQTWANLDEAVVLNEDGVTRQVAVDDRRVARVQVTAGKQRPSRRLMQTLSQFESSMIVQQKYLRAERICVHHLFQA